MTATAPTTFPSTVRGTISQRLIEKADRFFAGDLSTAITEILQNARRAGSSILKVTTTQVDKHLNIVIEDNGPGVVDPSVLFSLGESGWSAETSLDEDPAGAGFYALCGLTDEVRISSKGWRMIANKAVFLGQADAIVAPWLAEHQGLRIEFNITPKQDHGDAMQATRRSFIEHTFFSGMQVEYNGTKLPSGDFLDKAVATMEWNGIRIGMFRDHDTPYYRLRDAMDGYFYKTDIDTNFYGVLLRSAEFPDVTGFVGKDLPKSYKFAIDIRQATRIKMTLPQRDKLVQNAALSELQAVVQKFGYKNGLRLSDNRHRWSFAQWGKVKAMGIDAPEAVPGLVRFQPEGDENLCGRFWPEEVSGDRAPELRLFGGRIPIILNLEDRSEQINFMMGAIANADGGFDPSAIIEATSADGPERLAFFHPNENMLGYSWYDKIRVVDRVVFEARYTKSKIARRVVDYGDGDDTVENAKNDEFTDGPTLKDQPRELLLKFNISPALDDPQKVTQVEWPLPMLLVTQSEDYDQPDSATWLVSNAAVKLVRAEDKMDKFRAELSSILMAAYFSYCEDSDDIDDQIEYQEDAVALQLLRLLMGPTEACVSELKGELSDPLDNVDRSRIEAKIKKVDVSFTYTKDKHSRPKRVITITFEDDTTRTIKD